MVQFLGKHAVSIWHFFQWQPVRNDFLWIYPAAHDVIDQLGQQPFYRCLVGSHGKAFVHQAADRCQVPGRTVYPNNGDDTTFFNLINSPMKGGGIAGLQH